MSQLLSFDELLQQPKNDGKFTRKVIGIPPSSTEDGNQTPRIRSNIFDDKNTDIETNSRISIEISVNPWSAPLEDIFRQLQVTQESGLSEDECEERRKRFGKNKLTKKDIPFWKFFLKEVKEPMNILLLVVGVFYAIFGNWIDSIFVFCIILLMIFLEVQNEFRAKRAVQSLAHSVPKFTTVIRNGGEIKEIPSEDLVIGDIVLVKSGQWMACDCRLIKAISLEGESAPVHKDSSKVLAADCPLHERFNMLFAGSTITKGKGVGVVVDILSRDSSSLGSIHKLVNKETKKQKTPLEKMLAKLAKYLTIVSIILAVAIPLLVYLASVIHKEKTNIGEIILIGLSLAFATIPEELPIMIKAVLAVGSLRLAKRNLLIKDLKAAEMAGSVTTIVTDKTGTLTLNELHLCGFNVGFYSKDIVNSTSSNELEYDSLSTIVKHWLLSSYSDMNSLVSDNVTQRSDAIHSAINDPFDLAIWDFLLRISSQENSALTSNAPSVLSLISSHALAQLHTEYPVDSEQPFDHTTKTSHIRRLVHDRKVMYIKGAPDYLLERSSKFFNYNKVVEMDEISRNKVKNIIMNWAMEGKRVIAFGMKTVKFDNSNQMDDELDDVCYIGAFAFEDPVRDGVSHAISQCHDAGINVIMITGDHALTATAVSRQIGLIEELDSLCDGHKLDSMTDKDLYNAISNDKVTVISRATPEHKFRLVQTLQNNKHVVLVTGDGVNDAPALRTSDVGVAMGKKGVDLAKEAASMVILDDDFRTIVAGVTESRKLCDNLVKSIMFYLSCKLALVLLFTLAPLAGQGFPLRPIQVILLEMFMDIGASGTFVLEPAEADVMTRKPKKPKSAFNKYFWLRITGYGLSLFFGVLTAFLVGLNMSDVDVARSMAFTAWLIGHFVIAVHCRTIRIPVVMHGLFSNKGTLIWGIVVIISLIIVLYAPFLAHLMKLQPLNAKQLWFSIGVAVLFTLWMEILKVIILLCIKKKRKSKQMNQ